MKIALFCPTVSGRGGMETAIRNLKRGLELLGHECRLYLMGGSYDLDWLQGIEPVTIGSPAGSKLSRVVQYAFRPMLELRRWRPDAVIAADVTTLLMAVWARALSGMRQMPIASWLHFPLSEVRMKRWVRYADCHLAVSEAAARDLAGFLPGGSGPVFTIYNGTEVDRSLMVAEPGRPVFLYIGRLTYDGHKRVNDLIAAAALLRGDFEVRIVGDGRDGDPERLRALAEELEVGSRIRWHGWQADPWKLADGASALVMTSAYEVFGMVLIESLAHGLPVVSSDCVGGPREIVEPGHSGWLYPVGDVPGLAGVLQEILDHPERLPGREQVFGCAGKFSVAAVAERVVRGLVETRARLGTRG